MRRSSRRRTGRTWARRSAPSLVLACLVGLGSAAGAQEEGFEIEEDGYADEQLRRELTTFGSWIEIGALYNGSNDKLFGNYNGLLDEQGYFLGNLDILQRGLFGREDDTYGRLRGLNLGLDSRHIGAEAGRQGHYDLFFEFDELPVFRSETAQTFFGGAGNSLLTLPPGWVGLCPAGCSGGGQDSPQLQANLATVDIDWKRKRYSGGASLTLPANLGFDIRYDYETKEGQRLSGSAMGLNGGNPRAVVIPAPIDYVTQQVEAALNYAGESLQAKVGYYGSFFSNDKDFLQWQNPYTAAGNWPPEGASAGFGCGGSTAAGCGTGQKSLPPDNGFHQILASGGYDLPYHTRATLSTAFGWMEQDDNFLPYSVNTGLSVTTPLPRRSPDAEIFTTVVDFRLASKPLPKLHLDLAYHFDDRDNDTSRDAYIRIRGDAENQPQDQPGDPAASEQTRFNLPYSYEQHRIDFDAGYEVWRRTDLTLGYQWERTERDFQERDQVTENTLDVVLTSHPWAGVTGRLNYEHSWRDGDRYRGNDPFLDAHTPEGQAGGVNCANPEICPFENHPLLRKYHLADRDRDEIQLMLALQPLENLSLGINASYVDEDFDDTDVGLTRLTRAGSGIDLSWTPIERLTTHAFYSYQKYRTEQDGWSFLGFGDVIGQTQDPTNRWDSSDTDRTHTAGVGFSWNVLPELSLGADYLFADSRGRTEVGGPVVIPDPGDPFPVSYPKTRSRQHNVSLYGEYRFTPNLSTRVGYLYESFSRDDWALDGIAPTSLGCSGNACVIGSGRASEGYTASVVSWSVIYKFW